MSKISIKTDFKNGEKLFDTDLNNNFKVIQAGINANEENLQEVIDEAIIRLDAELEAITADRGWDWNGGDRVTFYKGDTSAVNSREIVNGQMLYNTDTGETALDDNGNRIVTGSGNVVAISSTQPTNEATKDWIKPITINGTETAEEYFKNNNNEWVKILTQPSGDTLPIGSISQFGGETAPTNWLFCNGQAVSRETYAELFSVIGTTYGNGDGSTTFNVPDFIGRVPVGLDEEDTDFDTLGETGGEKTHKLTISEMPKHTVRVPAMNWQVQGTSSGSILGNEGNYKQDSGEVGGDQPHNNMQPYTVTNFIIKAKQSVGLVGAITDNINDTNNNAVPNTKTVKDYVNNKVVETYSTDEIVIGTYLNKPLYRKVINMGNLVNNSSKNVAHNLSNFVIRTINGSATNGSVHIGISGFNDEVYIDKTNVTWNTKANRSSFTAYVVLEYTKQ